MTPRNEGELSTLEYHVLLAMADGPTYGYAIKDTVERESSGTLTPRAPSLYRVLARLLSWDLAREADDIAADEAHPGRTRRWYELTSAGRAALADEARRLRETALLAERRLGVTKAVS